MNTKIKIILALLTVIIIIGAIFGYSQQHENTCTSDDCIIEEAEKTMSKDLYGTGIIEQQKEITKDEANDKIDTIRKKIALKGLILKGDLHFENQEYTTALAKYLKIHKDIPDDLATTNKIGDTYYELKKYKQALSYYRNSADYIYKDKEKYLNSLLYAEKINPENIKDYQAEIITLELDPQTEFYYTNAFLCIEDYSLCKKNYQDYFALDASVSSTGSTLIVELQNIKDAITNYHNFQIDDLGYKNALITGAFFVNKLYPISIHTADQILKEKPGYRPMLKIIAQSYYEMGYYIEAKKHLNDYNALGDNDPEISYFLGVVYQKLNEYVLSVIHLKKSLSLGYKYPVDIRRRLIYNYYKLDEIDKILAIFQALFLENEEELSDYDFSLAIYYHILNNRLTEAKNYVEKAKIKYPKNEIFYGYYAWILLQEYENILKEKITEAGTGSIYDINNPKAPILNIIDSNIQKALDLDDKSPMIHLITGMLEQLKGDNKKAFIHYKQTISLDLGGDFEVIAEQRIRDLGSIQDNK